MDVLPFQMAKGMLPGLMLMPQHAPTVDLGQYELTQSIPIN